MTHSTDNSPASSDPVWRGYDVLSLSQELAVDRLSDRFEGELREGRHPRIEEYLVQLPVSVRAFGFQQLLAVELELTSAAGRRLDASDLRCRFPEYVAVVDLELQRASTARSPANSQHSTDVTYQHGPAASAPASPNAIAPPAARDFQDIRGDCERALPATIGRYRILRVVGEGSFGRVYLAEDSQLGRQVALKVPRRGLFEGGATTDLFLREARTAAQLHHPGIVTLHDVGQDGDIVFIVQEYLAGKNLVAHVQATSMTVAQRVELMANVADAVAYAHQKNFVHRDLKPANILLGDDGLPRLADFGLAVPEDIQRRLRGERSGTPAYMSPEQVRGETHRIGSRSDLWSLGVILFELLAGRRPFEGASQSELFDAIKYREPFSLRELQPELPAELERICLKCLSKRLSDRYSSARDLADDLRHWLRGEQQPTNCDGTRGFARIVPHGLRSFGVEDADYFLELLPGVRDRTGLPESVAFWKTRIESTSPETAFPVGLIYGPSGCGKSSLVKAALIPRLAQHVTVIYVEASAAETELKLLKGLKHHYLRIPTELSLPDQLQGLREGLWAAPHQKTLLVIDQFEQWLHTHRDEHGLPLLQALRHCDGGHLQCVLLVREDFWVRASCFVGGLDVKLVEGDNQALVELFEPPHARNVLAELGRAYGRLPDNLRELTADQQAFLDRAVEGLTENGKIICIRLTLLAEMVKGKPWNLDTWKDVGGVEGLGTAFLDATLASPSAPVVYRRHASTAQAVLRALLPELGTNIIGGRRSERALRDAAGGDAADFSEVIRILDKELRLISPSDSDGFVAPTSSDAAESTDARYYQLSHDFLIPVLRDWFNRRQRGTYRGRAELRLAELAALWNSKPENRYLPGSWEFVRLWSLTRSTSWTDGQRKMMRRGGRRHATRAVLLLAALPLFAWLGQEMFGRYHARRLVDQLPRTSIGELRVVADQVAAYAKWAVPLLREKTRAAAGNAVARRNLSLALLRADPRNHEQLIDFLYSEMLRAEAHELPAIREILASQSRKLNNRLWTVLIERGRDPGQQRLRAAGALASFDPGNAQWDDVAPEVAKQLVAVSHVHLKDWMSSLYPMRDKLLAPLTEIYRAANGGSPESVLAAHILVNYAADRPAVLADLISDATEAQFAIVFPALQRQGRQAIERLEAEIARTGEPSWHDEPLPVGWGSIDAALNAEIEAAEGLLTDRFAFVQTMPAERFFVACEALQSKGYRPAKFRPYQWLPSPPEDGCGERETPHLYVAAVWTRDGRDFVLKLDASPDELRAQDVRLRGEFFAPVDVAGYVMAAEGGSVDRYAGLWIKDSAAVDEVQLVVGVKAEFAPDHQQRHREGLHGVTMHQFLAADGRYRFSCIYRRQSEPTTIHRSQDAVNFANKAAQQQLQHDIALSEWEHVAFDRNYYEKILSQAEQALRVNPDSGEALRSRGVAQHALRRDALAVEDLTTVLAANPKDVTALWMRASSHARLGNAAAAASDVALTSQPVHHESHAPFVRAVVSAWQGDTSPLRLFRDMLAVHSHEWRWLYNAACAHAVAVSALEQDAESSANLAHEALDLLRRAVTAGFPHPSAIWSDPDLNSIRHRDEYRKILADAGFGHSISSVWGTSSAYESVVLHGIPPRELRARCQELVAQHYRPVAISVANVSPTSPGAQPIAAIVWHRPLTPNSARQSLAIRQAGAAVALLRQGEREKILGILRTRENPESMTQFIHRCRTRDVTATDLWECARIADSNRRDLQGDLRRIEDRVLYALLLALGDYSPSDLRQEQRDALVDQLERWYSRDASAAIHGAAGWLLQKWGESALVKRVDETPSSYHPSREWFTRAIQAGRQRFFQTYIVIPAGEYDIGSPEHEPARKSDEARHRVRIPQAFAILDREITRAEVEAFDPAFRTWHVSHAPTPQHAFAGPNWYESVRFCRWMTQRADLTEDDQAYSDPDELNRRGYEREASRLSSHNPRHWPVDLTKPGFRLPIEAEWEVAARAGTNTPYSFGADVGLLHHYGWYGDRGGQRAQLPKQLRPNAWGLFDTMGNLGELCHDCYDVYRLGLTFPAPPGLATGESGSHRLFRGGNWTTPASSCRTAWRLGLFPHGRHTMVGIRLAFTLTQR